MSNYTSPYAAPIDQAWLRFWVGLYGPDSALSRYLTDAPLIETRPSRAFQLPQPQRHTPQKPVRPNGLNGQKSARPAQPKPERPVPKTERLIERDIQRITRLPTSEWARQIVGDERISGITLRDILDGIEDYFEIFDRLRRVNKQAHDYFSRVGAPIVLRNTMVLASQCEAMTVAKPSMLPSYFGLFITRTRDEYREEILDDTPSLFDFHLFEKPKNFATVAPLGTTVFTHQVISLKRNAFSPEELKHHPCARHSFGTWWYLGVAPDGQVRALPLRMSHTQDLPRGGTVHHSAFQIPPGLYEMGTEKGNPHKFVRIAFNIGIAFAASGLSGIQVTIKKDRKAVRFGIPVSALKNFFADRDAGGLARRTPILHLRSGHDRHMADGRIIPVGEHLSGERFFSWRGYDIAVGVPGIHFAAPEGLTAPVYIANDPDAPLPPDAPAEMASLASVGDVVRKHLWTDRRNPIRRGEPTDRYTASALPKRGEK